MTTENSVPAESGGSDLVTFTPEEDAFFASGGETAISEDPAPTNSGENPPAPTDDGKAPPVDAKMPPADKTPQNVPLAALHEERNKRKALGTEVETLRTQLAEQSGKLSILLKLKGGDVAAETPAGPPSVDEDIFGAVKATNDTVAQLQKRLDDEAAAKTANEESASQAKAYRDDCDAFAAKPETADFRDAYNHLLASRLGDLIALGYDNPLELQKNGADPEAVKAAERALQDAIAADEYAIAERARASKKSPAAILYSLAKQRGYVKKAADGKSAPKPADDQLDRIERGQQSNKSLSDAGGGGPDEMSAERLNSMSLAEFEAYSAKHPARVRALMGG